VGYLSRILISPLILGYNLNGNANGFSPRIYDIYPFTFSASIFLPSVVISPCLSKIIAFVNSGLLSFANNKFNVQTISLALLNIGVAVNNTNLTLTTYLSNVLKAVEICFLPVSVGFLRL